MNKSRLLGAVCAVTLVVLGNTANAAVVNPIIGLTIGNTVYDVTFHDGAGESFNAIWDANNDGVFDSAEPTFWGDEAGAQAAAAVIRAFLGTNDRTRPGDPPTDAFYIPHTTQDSGTMITSGEDIIISECDATPLLVDGPCSAPAADSLDVSRTTPYATFEVTAIPVPAAVWLFTSGLIALIGVTRRTVRA